MVRTIILSLCSLFKDSCQLEKTTAMYWLLEISVRIITQCVKFDCFYTANICTVDASYNSVKFSCLCEVTQFTYLLFILSYFIPILLLKNAFEFLHKFCSKFSINIALSHVHIQGYEAYMLIKCIGSVQRFTTKGWTETAIMLCKLNKSL